jgi:hypothetical protein
MARGNTQIYEVVRALPLTNSAITRISNQLPLGEGWYKMLLRLNATITTGTATGALLQGLLRYLRSITLRTDKGEYLCNSIPARALYDYDTLFAATAARLDAVANGLQQAIIEIWFYDPRSRFPEDTILDTSRYSAITLEVSAGSIADLYSTVGTGAVVSTLDVYIVRQRGPVPQKVKPRFYREFGVRVPVDGTGATSILLERASNLAYRSLMFFTANTTTVAGVPFSGDANDAMASEFRVEHNGGIQYGAGSTGVLWVPSQQEAKQLFGIETWPVGLAVVDFTEDGSLNSALYSGDKSMLQLVWVIGTGGTLPQWSLAYEAVRPLI